MADSINPQVSFDRLKANVVQSIGSHFPFEGRQRKAVLNKIWVDDNLDINDLKSQSEARIHGRTWGVPIKGDISLIDVNTGKVLDRKTTTLARLPKLTSRYGYIVDGNEYQIDHLFRLKSGVYARVQNNGDLESEFNLSKSPFGNRALGIHVDRNSKKISLLKGGAHISLYPILKATGVSDDQIEKEWGKDIFRANQPKSSEHFEKELHKFWSKTSKDGDPAPKDLGGLVKHVHDVFDQTGLLPETTKITLGKPFTKVNGEVLHLATAKLLGVARGDHAQDDRDSLSFKEVASIDDFIPEKLEKASKRTTRTVRNTIDYKDSLGEIITSNLFGKPVKEFFTKGSSVVERSDQTNPVQMLSAHRKTTVFAPDYGGIKNENAMNDNALRGINPSHIGFLDPMKTPESERTGISVNLSLQSRKNGKDIELPVFNKGKGKGEYLNASDFHGVAAVLPDQVKWVKGKPQPISPMVKVKLPGGAIETRPWKDVHYVMPSAKGMFDVTSNLIPFLPCDQGNRVSFADKQMEQAISLTHREAPLVQSKSEHPTDQTHTFERAFGTFSSHRSVAAGKVVEVRKDMVVVQDDAKKKHVVHLYDHFPLNESKGMMHSDPVVKVGDSVKKGDLLADTNYTKGGAIAIGSNLRVGYIPYKGYNFEDGIVISESAAKKFTSDHLHKLDLELDPETDKISKGKFLAHAQHRSVSIGREALDALDDEGIIRVGTKVKSGQVLVAAVGENVDKKAGVTSSSYGARAFKPYRDKSLIWDEDHVGTVVRVVKSANGKGVKVHVRTEEPAVIGDKLSGRHGNKGIITQILPDHEMPHTIDKDGEKRHLEVLLNPSGVPTRINVGQIMETAAAKIAEKTGKPYVVDNFAGPNHDYRKQVVADLKKHGLSDEEHVYDPSDPKNPLGSVLVGPQYLMKLKHQVEKKLVARGVGTTTDLKTLKYDADRQPTKGGQHGGQGFGALEVYSLLAHDARHNLREMATYKSDKQDTHFWTRVQEGFEPPAPDTPFAYKKFVGLLQGLGVDVKKNGSTVQLLPMTDQRILELAGGPKGEIKKPHLIIRGKDIKPEKGGLFDPDVTGGPEGTKWGFIKLHEPMPNPIFMGQKQKPGPIPALLGMKMEDLQNVIVGKSSIDGQTGGRAIQEALKKVNVGKEISSLQARMPNLKGTNLDQANRKLKYLLALKEHDLKPHEAYVLNYVPVVPPVFRPVTPTPSGDLHANPLNGLYKNIAITNNELKTFDPKIHVEGSMRTPLRQELWEGLQSLQAVGGAVGHDSDSPGGRKKLKGILSIIGNAKGEQPKKGYFQSKLVKKRQDLSIRSTIIPEPGLGLDEVGLPRTAAMELYRPFVVSELVKRNFSALDAQMEVKKGSESAARALEKVINDRPLLLKRDPALHKFSVMAFRPVLHDGKAIKIHPLVTGGFNADFDGDTMAGTVPVSKEAVEEAHRMFPSKNLFSSTNFGVMYAPTQESMLGLHLLTKWGKPTGKTFQNPVDLNLAVEKGEVKHNDVVKVGGKETTFGRLLVNSRFPKGFAHSEKILHDPSFDINKGRMFDLATHLAKNHEKDFGTSINGLKDLGNDHSFKAGFSFGLKDLATLPGRDRVLAKADLAAEKIRKTVKGQDNIHEALVGEHGVYTKATKELDALAEAHYKGAGQDNRLMTMVYSGARGKKEQLRQMIAAPMLLQDSTNRTVVTPVKKSYAEGLDLGDYWISQHGARKGTLQRAQGTSLPGALTKDIINTTISTLVTSHDCKTKEGIHVDLHTEKDLHDRFLAVPYKLKNGQTLKAGTLMTPEILTALKNSKHDKAVVRSPLKCHQTEGICAKCFGLNESGKLHTSGTNIGVLSGQALGEPATQMAMDAFHSGGIAGNRGAASVDRFTRLRQLLDMPDKLKNQATVARASGPITAVKKDLGTGGVEIFVGGQRHYVPREISDDQFNVGVEVKKGQSLSHYTAPINPHHLYDVMKDIHSVQNYLTQEIYKGYEKEGVRKRNVEVVVRGMTNLTKVRDPGSSSWNHGDVVSRSVVEGHNKGVKKGDKHVHHEPILTGIKQVTLTGSEDWMARLNFIGLGNTIIEGASKSWKSNLHGAHPIPGLAHGTEFGKPPAGSKKHHY